MADTARGAFVLLREAADDGRLDAICARLGIRLLGVFGSAVDPSTEPRDLDVSVSWDDQPRLLELIDELTLLTGFEHIDVLVLDRAEPVARARGVTGIGLFEAKPGLWATTQMAALAEARDTAHLRALDLKALQR